MAQPALAIGFGQYSNPFEGVTPNVRLVGPPSAVLLLDRSSLTVAHCLAGVEGVRRFSPACDGATLGQ